MGTDGDGSGFDPRPDIKCPEVGKTGSRVLRLMNGRMGRTPIAVGLGLPTGAAGSRFDATKGHVDSATLRRQGR
jgi:hypothetical protein